MFEWPQATTQFPLLRALTEAAKLNLELKSAISHYFSFVGKAFKAPSATLLLSHLPVPLAVELSRTNRQYIYSTRTSQAQAHVHQHRLCTEKYASNSKRMMVHPIETLCTRTHASGELGAKSGQTTLDERFRYDLKGVFYHEKYQKRFLGLFLF